jgi:hypothetical protein
MTATLSGTAVAEPRFHVLPLAATRWQDITGDAAMDNLPVWHNGDYTLPRIVGDQVARNDDLAVATLARLNKKGRRGRGPAGGPS